MTTYGSLRTEEHILDDVEAATRNLYMQAGILPLPPPSPAHLQPLTLSAQTLMIQDTVQGQNRKLDSLKDGMSDASHGLSGQRQRIQQVRADREGFCWMYAVIALEALLLVYLLSKGLS